MWAKLFGFSILSFVLVRPKATCFSFRLFLPNGWKSSMDFSFQRNLMDSEVSNFALMLGMIEEVYFSSGKSDIK